MKNPVTQMRYLDFEVDREGRPGEVISRVGIGLQLTNITGDGSGGRVGMPGVRAGGWHEPGEGQEAPNSKSEKGWWGGDSIHDQCLAAAQDSRRGSVWEPVEETGELRTVCMLTTPRPRCW